MATARTNTEVSRFSAVTLVPKCMLTFKEIEEIHAGWWVCYYEPYKLERRLAVTKIPIGTYWSKSYNVDIV